MTRYCYWPRTTNLPYSRWLVFHHWWSFESLHKSCNRHFPTVLQMWLSTVMSGVSYQDGLNSCPKNFLQPIYSPRHLLVAAAVPASSKTLLTWTRPHEFSQTAFANPGQRGHRKVDLHWSNGLDETCGINPIKFTSRFFKIGSDVTVISCICLFKNSVIWHLQHDFTSCGRVPIWSYKKVVCFKYLHMLLSILPVSKPVLIKFVFYLSRGMYK